MQSTTTLVIGAGQCGLAMSHELSRRSIDHIVVDAGRAGESWRSRRWDSLRLLTPNWMNVLAGEAYSGSDANEFMTAGDFAARFDAWIAANRPPLLEGTRIFELSRFGDGYKADTDHGPILCRSAVIATGACARTRLPAFAVDLPARIRQISPIAYRNPSVLSPGNVLVVGASASGLQIARELALSGRKVTLAVGSHGRLPRTYRGEDILLWMHLVRAFDEPFTKVDDLERVRRTPSLPLIGSPEHADLDLNVLQTIGVEITGRLADIRGGRALFSGGLANLCASADLKMKRLLDRIDDWLEVRGMGKLIPPSGDIAPTSVPDNPRLSLALDEIDTVIWATGFTPDHRFLKMPVFDRKGRVIHHGGVVAPGLCVMGLPHQRTARSVHIDGAPRDAKALARHIVHGLDQQLAA